MTSYSEDGCDLWIAENLALPSKGFFLDVGAAHPWKYSRTAFLREMGWTGFAVDGNGAYRPEYEGVQNVVFHHAVVSTKSQVNFLPEPTNALVSRVHPTGFPMQTETLDKIMFCGVKLDFLNLDIEGQEYDALLSLALDKYPPIIVSEYASTHAGQDFRVLHHLVNLGYEVRHVTGSNIVYYRL